MQSHYNDILNRRNLMPSLIEAESTLTSRYQTTVPEPVRRALRLSKHDKLHYSLRDSGDIVISRAIVQAETDPALESFLDFLATDIQNHPARLQALTKETQRSISKFTKGVKFDRNAPLNADDE
jgi:antitoxin PrlF